jgi:hypothetical protein
MRCPTCVERPGFVRRPEFRCRDRYTDELLGMVWQPCPDCNGTAVAHCCDGLCEQPDG